MSYFYALAVQSLESFFGILLEYDSPRVICGSELERNGNKGVCWHWWRCLY